MDDMDEYLGSDDLLGEAMREIEIGDSNVEQEYNDSPVTVFIPVEQDRDIELDENYGMRSFSFSSGLVPDDIISSFVPSSDWVNTVPHLSIFVPWALAKTGLDAGTQSEDSLFYFNDMWKELEKHTPASVIHNMMCKDLVALIRNSTHDRFCPVESVMSKLFNHIGKPAYGMEMEADQSVFRLINSLLRTFPPSNTGGRYYWLQVLSDLKSPTTKVSKKKIKKETVFVKEEKELTERTEALRKLVIDSFTGNGTSLNMQEFLVNVLEADLFGLRAEGEKKSKPEEERRKSLSRVQVKGFSDDLKDVPLAYLIFYEANDKRRRGLTEHATSKVLQIVDFLKENEHEPRVRAITSRLLCVLLEALRWFSSQVSQEFEGKNVSYELQSDVRRIGRQFTKNGFSEWEVSEMMPIDWIQDHMFIEK